MKAKLSALLMILLSAAGVLLQIRSRQTSYDALNLPVPGSFFLTALWIFFVLVLVLAIVFALIPMGRGTNRSLYGQISLPGQILGLLAGVVTAVGSLYRLVGTGLFSGVRPAVVPVLDAVVSLLLLAGGISMIWLSFPHGERKLVHPLAALLPGFADCFWLVMFYHSHSQDPVIAHYGWTLLCLMASLLAIYFQAACSFEHPHARAALVFTLTAGVYAFTALPTAESLSEFLLLLGLGVWMLFHCILLPGLAEPGQAPVPERGTEA